MEDCIPRKICFLKKKFLWIEEYGVNEITEHEFIDSSIEYLKFQTQLNPTLYYQSFYHPKRLIYCKHCGKITYQD